MNSLGDGTTLSELVLPSLWDSISLNASSPYVVDAGYFAAHYVANFSLTNR